MRLFPRLVATLSFLLVSTVVHAQTIANIGSFAGEEFRSYPKSSELPIIGA